MAMSLRYVSVESDGSGGSRPLDVEVELIGTPAHSGVPPLRVSSPMRAEAVRFVEVLPGGADDWHPAPSRQLTVILSGVVELETTDGTVRRFGPGDVAMAADMGSNGHRLRVVEGPLQTMFVQLADD